MRYASRVFVERVLSIVEDTTPTDSLDSLRENLRATPPEQLLVRGFVSEANEDSVQRKTQTLYKYTVDDRIVPGEADIAVAAGLLRVVKTWMGEALKERELRLAILACCVMAYLPFEPVEIMGTDIDGEDRHWFCDEATRLLQGLKCVLRHDRDDTARAQNALGEETGELDASDARSLDGVLHYLVQSHVPGQIAVLARLLFRLDRSAFATLSASIKSLLAAWTILSPLSGEEQLALVNEASSGSKWLFFEVFRQNLERRQKVDDGRIDELAACLKKLAGADVGLFLRAFSAMRWRRHSSRAFGVALTELPSEVALRLARELNVSSYDHGVIANAELLTGLLQSDKTDGVRSFCHEVHGAYLNLSNRLCSDRETAILSPLTTDCQDIIVQHLSDEMKTSDDLDKLLASAIDELIGGESEWAWTSTQRTTRFLVSLGKICLLAQAAVRAKIVLPKSDARSRLQQLLADSRLTAWYVTTPEGNAKLAVVKELLRQEVSRGTSHVTTNSRDIAEDPQGSSQQNGC
jgi:hypothetical protein